MKLSAVRRVILTAIIFWAGIAASQTRQPQPVEIGGANLPAQTIGANDLIAISVYEAPELTRTVRVGADGEIRLPMLQRRIRAQGLFPADLETQIAAALQSAEILVEPVVTVTIVQYHSRPISVVGAVRKPLVFQAEGPVTLIDAITKAEGLSPEAGPEILVSAKQPENPADIKPLVRRIPVKGLIDEADPALNLKLFGGEEIRIPEGGKVFVVGNVHKPGAFPVQDASGTSVLKLLALSEGLIRFADRRAFIYRREAGSQSKSEIPIELKKIMDRKAPDVTLEANDILYIPDDTGRRMTVTTLERLAAFGGATASGVLIWRR